MWFFPVHLINLCFCCSLTYRPVVKAEYGQNLWRKEWLWCDAPDWNSELQVSLFTTCVSLPREWNAQSCGLTDLLCSSSMVLWVVIADRLYCNNLTMLSFLHCYCRIFASTWNVGGKSPPRGLNLDDWLHSSPPADIYVLGCVLPKGFIIFWT